jgi:hypothetical protein
MREGSSVGRVSSISHGNVRATPHETAWHRTVPHDTAQYRKNRSNTLRLRTVSLCRNTTSRKTPPKQIQAIKHLTFDWPAVPCENLNDLAGVIMLPCVTASKNTRCQNLNKSVHFSVRRATHELSSVPNYLPSSVTKFV